MSSTDQGDKLEVYPHQRPNPILAQLAAEIAAIMAIPAARREVLARIKRPPSWTTPQDWVATLGRGLAKHCKDTGHRVWDCDFFCVAKGYYSKEPYVRKRSSEKGVKLAQIQAVAWRTMGHKDRA